MQLFTETFTVLKKEPLIEEANESMDTIQVNKDKVKCWRTRRKIWQLDLTCVVYISEKLLKGQIRGIRQDIEKLFCRLNKLKEGIKTPTKRGKKRMRKDLEKR